MSIWRKERLVTGVVAGAVLAVLAGVYGCGSEDRTAPQQRNGVKDTGVYFREDATGNCLIASKEATVFVGQNDGTAIWNLRNGCTTAQTVTLSNFRDVGVASSGNCTTETVGNAVYPFTQPARDVVVPARPGGSETYQQRTMPFTVKNTITATQKYDFDLCVNGARNDPQLIIER